MIFFKNLYVSLSVILSIAYILKHINSPVIFNKYIINNKNNIVSSIILSIAFIKFLTFFQTVLPKYPICLQCIVCGVGLVTTIIGIVIIILDYCVPEKLSDFFGVDITQDLEEFYAEPEGM